MTARAEGSGEIVVELRVQYSDDRSTGDSGNFLAGWIASSNASSPASHFQGFAVVYDDFIRVATPIGPVRCCTSALGGDPTAGQIGPSSNLESFTRFRGNISAGEVVEVAVLGLNFGPLDIEVVTRTYGWQPAWTVAESTEVSMWAAPDNEDSRLEYVYGPTGAGWSKIPKDHTYSSESRKPGLAAAIIALPSGSDRADWRVRLADGLNLSGDISEQRVHLYTGSSGLEAEISYQTKEVVAPNLVIGSAFFGTGLPPMTRAT